MEANNLISEQRINDDFVMVYLLNFHLSFEKVMKEVWSCIHCQPSVGRILQANFPDDVAILVPADRHTTPFSDKWYCITKTSPISHTISTVDKNSLVNAIPVGKRPVILLSHTYDYSLEASKN